MGWIKYELFPSNASDVRSKASGMGNYKQDKGEEQIFLLPLKQYNLSMVFWNVNKMENIPHTILFLNLWCSLQHQAYFCSMPYSSSSSHRQGVSEETCVLLQWLWGNYLPSQKVFKNRHIRIPLFKLLFHNFLLCTYLNVHFCQWKIPITGNVVKWQSLKKPTHLCFIRFNPTNKLAK